MLLGAVASAAALTGAGGATAATLRAEAVLPPGQSGHVSIAGVLSGTGSPHLYDQVELFQNFEFRSFMFNQPGETEVPRDGVTIVRDAYGVPSITANDEYDAWWGVGYAIAQDRLFQLELFRRATSGHLAEIQGSTYLDDDLIARRDYYTGFEVDQMIELMPQRLIDRLVAYRDGVNAWVDHVRANPGDLPGEFVALTIPVRDWSIRDSARVGIFLARTVPSGDGVEFANARALQSMSANDFDLLHPVHSPSPRTTIPAVEGAFPSQPGRTDRDEAVGFRRSREFVDGLDLESATDTASAVSSSVGTPMGAPTAGGDLRRLFPSPGGSFMWAVGDRENGRGYQFNGPQLGYSVPELFVEFELHSPENPNLRGVTAPGVPLVGIGHNGHVAWGFTSGLSDEDDLFAERVTGPETYRFRGRERRMECRNEVLDWNTPVTSLPGLITDGGVPAGSVTERVCRTVHGPVQYVGDGVAMARSYAIWGRELETFIGLDLLNRADSIHDVDRALRRVTWNENVIAADDRGNIGYWHPGLHPLRPLRWDERLPYPGDGRAEWRGLLPRAQTPHVINPDQGWLTNWNNLPSIGWTNGDSEARERLAGPYHRVRILQRLVRRLARNPSFARNTAVVETSGTTAQQRPFVDEGRLRAARERADAGGARLIAALLAWDGNYARMDAAGTVDPGVAIWEEFKSQLERVLIGPMGPGAEILAGGTGSSHGFDITPGEANALRLLGAGAYATAAERAAKALTERFGSATVSAWRAPRLLYDVSAQGAGGVDYFPFFDRGTWEQSVMVGRR
jgi:penicillin amidase